MAYWLTPPTRMTFISLVLVILALLAHYAHGSSTRQDRVLLKNIGTLTQRARLGSVITFLGHQP
jgi:ABC-type transport system involved in cytochrome c biogenesis permease subunit